MAGGHAGHAYGVSADADAGKLSIALGLILGFMAVEVAVGIIAHSLALLSDAGHMLTDAAAIGFSLLAARLVARPAKGAMTYGLKRVEILSAQANGVTLLTLAAFISYEAIRRLFNPTSGKSPPDSRPCPRTSWSTPTPTATPPDGRWTRCSTTTSTSSTPRWKSTTKAPICSTFSRSSLTSAPAEIARPFSSQDRRRPGAGMSASPRARS